MIDKIYEFNQKRIEEIISILNEGSVMIEEAIKLKKEAEMLIDENIQLLETGTGKLVALRLERGQIVEESL